MKTRQIMAIILALLLALTSVGRGDGSRVPLLVKEPGRKNRPRIPDRDGDRVTAVEYRANGKVHSGTKTVPISYKWREINFSVCEVEGEVCMKRIIFIMLLLMGFFFVSVVENAEANEKVDIIIDLSEYSVDALFEIQREINNLLVAHGGKVTLPNGPLLVGRDIAAGNYIIEPHNIIDKDYNFTIKIWKSQETIDKYNSDYLEYEEKLYEAKKEKEEGKEYEYPTRLNYSYYMTLYKINYQRTTCSIILNDGNILEWTPKYSDNLVLSIEKAKGLFMEEQGVSKEDYNYINNDFNQSIEENNEDDKIEQEQKNKDKEANINDDKQATKEEPKSTIDIYVESEEKETLEVTKNNAASFDITQPMQNKLPELPSISSENGVAGITKCYVNESNDNKSMYLTGYVYVNETDFDGSRAKNWLIVIDIDTKNTIAGYPLTQKRGISGLNHNGSICKNAEDTDFEICFDVSEYKDGNYSLAIVLGYMKMGAKDPTYKYYVLDENIFFIVKDGRIIVPIVIQETE